MEYRNANVSVEPVVMRRGPSGAVRVSASCPSELGDGSVGICTGLLARWLCRGGEIVCAAWCFVLQLQKNETKLLGLVTTAPVGTQ